jgi:hypothetical protein
VIVYDPSAPGWNENTPWSEEAIRDLMDASAHGDTVAEIAVFLQRSEDEVLEKMAEVGLAIPPRDVD